MVAVHAHDLASQVEELLRRLAEEGESIDVLDHGRIVARLVPVGDATDLRSRSRRAETAAALRELKRIGREISERWPDGVSAVDAVRDVRRDL